jgi:hypothetical protein
MRQPLLIALILALSACTSNWVPEWPGSSSHSKIEPNPIVASCADLDQERAANNARLAQIAQDDHERTAKAVTVGVAGLLVWPGWFTPDLSTKENPERDRLNQRNSVLTQTAAQRGCDTEAHK